MTIFGVDLWLMLVSGWSHGGLERMPCLALAEAVPETLYINGSEVPLEAFWGVFADLAGGSFFNLVVFNA